MLGGSAVRLMAVNGQPVRLNGPEQAVALGIGTVPRERRVEGLVMFLSIAQNITLANLGAVMRFGLIDHRREREVAEGWLRRLRIKAPNVHVACRKLSGGNQQKVVLARWMMAGSRIPILDHPTRGLDVGAKEEVYELVRDLSAGGIGVVLLSDTLVMVLADTAVLFLLATAETFVILLGGIDLSIQAIASLASVLLAQLLPSMIPSPTRLRSWPASCPASRAASCMCG